MSMNNEVYQMNVEHVLHDVIDVVCKCLDGKDLANMAKVCKQNIKKRKKLRRRATVKTRSWRCAAFREKRKRNYFQRLRLPYKISNLVNALYEIPSVSLLFYDSTLEKSLSLPRHNRFQFSLSNGLDEEVLENFKTQLPNETIVFMVEELHDDELTGKCDILGFFLPSVERRIEINVAYVQLKDEKQLAEELGLNDCKYPKSTIILLGTYCFMDHTSISELGNRAQQNGKEITLASLYGNKLVAGNCHSESDEGSYQSAALLRISGPTVESWSTFIFFTAQRDEIERKLLKLKERVKRKRHYTGLFYAPKCTESECKHAEHPCGNSHEIMSNLNRIFPNIRFTGFFTYGYYTKFVIPHYKELVIDRFDENDVFNRGFLDYLPNYISIIILSYD